ncbi:zona pellucida sperm-binding protein 3-like [Amia ocellicauda]|uniref:zona pellucida sperm-binding protein 3 n=1 Tax=Amia ocellicauda TaxID=2972642 RepID=UPI003464B9EA
MRVVVFCLCFAETLAFSIFSSRAFQEDSDQQSEMLLDEPSDDPSVVSRSMRPDSSLMADDSDRTSGAQPRQDVSVTCGETNLVVRVKKNLYGFGFQDARLTLGSSCSNNSVDLITGDLLFSYNLQDCDSQRLIFPRYTIYRTILYYVPSRRAPKEGGVPRINVEIECSYESDEYDGDVFSLQLMNSAWTASSLTNVYSTGELLHFQARGYPKAEGQQLFIGSCYATLSEYPQSFPQYKIIDHYGCMNHKLGASSKFHPPRADGVINFAVDAGELNLVSKIYIHCVLFLGIQGTTLHTKSCNFDPTRQRWEGLELVDGVCDCCESNCTAPLLTSITTDLQSTGPILIQEGTARRTASARDGDLLWFQVKGGATAYQQDGYDVAHYESDYEDQDGENDPDHDEVGEEDEEEGQGGAGWDEEQGQDQENRARWDEEEWEDEDGEEDDEWGQDVEHEEDRARWDEEEEWRQDVEHEEDRARWDEEEEWGQDVERDEDEEQGQREAHGARWAEDRVDEEEEEEEEEDEYEAADEPVVDSMDEDANEDEVETIDRQLSADASQVDNQREVSGTKASMLEVAEDEKPSLELEGFASNVSKAAQITLDDQGNPSLPTVSSSKE